MRATLGDALWADIVAHANACKEDAFSSAFPKPVLRCVGPPHGGACPHNFRVDLTSARAYAALGELHLDHEQDSVVTCDMWVQALAAPLPRAPATLTLLAFLNLAIEHDAGELEGSSRRSQSRSYVLTR